MMAGQTKGTRWISSASSLDRVAKVRARINGMPRPLRESGMLVQWKLF